MRFEYDTGGCASNSTSRRDCVTRAIAIATGMNYTEVYAELSFRMKQFANGKSRQAKRLAKQVCITPRNGVPNKVIRDYLDTLGWTWHPTMQIGSGCKVHLTASELPMGTLIVRTSKHLTCVIDHVIHDTHDPSRDGNRCVYGYWTKDVLSAYEALVTVKVHRTVIVNATSKHDAYLKADEVAREMFDGYDKVEEVTYLHAVRGDKS
jgi:hypothetical protein